VDFQGNKKETMPAKHSERSAAPDEPCKRDMDDKADSTTWYAQFGYMLNWHVSKHWAWNFFFFGGLVIWGVLQAMEFYQEHNNPNSPGVTFSGIKVTDKVGKRYVLNIGGLISLATIAADHWVSTVKPCMKAGAGISQTTREENAPILYHLIDALMFTTSLVGLFLLIHYWNVNRNNALAGMCMLLSPVAFEGFMLWLRVWYLWNSFSCKGYVLIFARDIKVHNKQLYDMAKTFQQQVEAAKERYTPQSDGKTASQAESFHI